MNVNTSTRLIWRSINNNNFIKMFKNLEKKRKKYILWFAQEHVEFRQAEFDSIVKLSDLEHCIISEDLIKPFWIVEFADDESALKFASRSVALRAIIEHWADSNNLSLFHENLAHYVYERKEALSSYFQEDKTFKITVETYNKHYTQKEKIDKIETLNCLTPAGNVDLKAPNVEWWYIEFWGLDPTDVPEYPDNVLFGRFLSNGQRHLIKELSLKNRKFIGNTSMDAQLSLLMANQGLVQNGDIVFDPFVGTGSLLVSAAIFGGYVLGADIDFMMLHALSRPSRITQKVREKDESIRANLKQYGCADKYLDVLVSDFSNPLWRNDVQFEAIITDPPYGIREATERIQTKQSSKKTTRTAEMPHYPSTSHYALHKLYADLLIFAAKHLVLGGRLVCWLPFHREDYSEEIVPQHYNLRLVSNCEQPLTGQTSRRLLTYEKHSEPGNTEDNLLLIQPPLSTEFRERYFDNGLESRKERRIRRSELRRQGHLEALKRGKNIVDSRELKCNLNKARFS